MRLWIALLLMFLLPTQAVWSAVQAVQHVEAVSEPLSVHEHEHEHAGATESGMVLGDSVGHDHESMEGVPDRGEGGAPHSHGAHYHPVLTFVGMEQHRASVLMAGDFLPAGGTSSFRSRVPPLLDRPPAGVR